MRVNELGTRRKRFLTQETRSSRREGEWRDRMRKGERVDWCLYDMTIIKTT